MPPYDEQEKEELDIPALSIIAEVEEKLDTLREKIKANGIKNDTQNRYVMWSLLKCDDFISYVEELDTNEGISNFKKTIQNCYIKYNFMQYRTEIVDEEFDILNLPFPSTDGHVQHLENSEGRFNFFKILEQIEKTYEIFKAENENPSDLICPVEITVVYWDGTLLNVKEVYRGDIEEFGSLIESKVDVLD